MEPGERFNPKKRRNDWREDAAFLDATSTVSASTFGARRLPELKNLYFQVRKHAHKNDNSHKYDDDDLIIHERKTLLSGGGKRSSRHLRRRTTAVQSKTHRHRYPFQTYHRIGDTGNDGFTGDHAQPAYKGETRKSRRKKRSLLQGKRLKWLEGATRLSATTHESKDAEDETNDSSIASAPKSWLVTHLWHSKRFHLLSPPCETEGFPTVLGEWTGIPLVHTNRGPRAALRLSQNKDDGGSDTCASSVLVRDVTWEVQPLVVCASATDSSPAPFLLQHMGKICPGLVAVSQQGETLANFRSGSLSLEETVYEPDSFPAGAIGPAVWRMLPNHDKAASTTASIELRCHPSIHTRIQEILQQLTESVPTQNSSVRMEMGGTIHKNLPRICFRLYGVASLKVLNKVLKLQRGDVSTVIEKEQSSSEMLSHGSIVPLENVAIAGALAETTMKDDVTLIYRAPRPLDCPANRAMAGWEIHCSDADFAKALWLALVTLNDSPASFSSAVTKKDTIRGCCAIGLIEDCHMRLECEPPIPLFPRDYVDTQDAQRYWKDSSSPSSFCLWKRIRQLCEGGWGRLPLDKERRIDKLETIDFSKLVAPDNAGSDDGENDEETASTIVAVRGTFGQPFVDAIQGACGNYAPTKEDNDPENSNEERAKKRRRRNRRPTRPKNQVILAPPLPRASRASLGDYCHRLSSSMSLPAVLLVHVRAVGSGRISPGMEVVCADATLGLLGRITAGGFSTSRGVCHGLGVVGAVRLLNYLGRTTGVDDDGSDDEEKSGSSHPTKTNSLRSYGRIVRLANGAQSLQLLVRVANTAGNKGSEEERNDAIGCEASLSVLI